MTSIWANNICKAAKPINFYFNSFITKTNKIWYAVVVVVVVVVGSLSQDLRPLEDGDLVNVDVTLYLNGFHADTARSWICGTGDATGQRHLHGEGENSDYLEL